MIAPQIVLPLGAELGEGPVWIATDRALWFVDIKGRLIHRFDPATADHRHWRAPEQPGWVLPADDGALLTGLKTGLHRFDPTDGSFVPLHDPEPHLSGNRLNDATVDPAGCLWFGSMDDGETAGTGRLYSFAEGRAIDSGLPPVAITNGPAVSPDGMTLYHTDTLGRTIWGAPIRDDGSLGPPAIFVEIEDGAGHPDGSTVDAEGGVWVALFGGWAVRRYDPTGKLMTTIRFPVANITKIAFGGDDLATAYATTAHKGLDEAARAEQPHAGDLFAFDPGVRGLPGTPVRL